LKNKGQATELDPNGDGECEAENFPYQQDGGGYLTAVFSSVISRIRGGEKEEEAT
jgi:hypothetical protein